MNIGHGVATATGRDLRLDFFRGLALFSIFIDHIPNNVLGQFTMQAAGFSDAAEVFIFISGYAAGMVYGRVYDPTSLGAVSLIKLTAFGSALIAILMLFVVVRHSRAEEESGRLELLSGTRLGHAAPLTGALTLAVGASLVLGVLTAAWLIEAGLPAEGSFAFGLGWTATGIAFAGVGAVAAQLTTGARAARAIGLVVIAVTYGLRAIGDLAEPGPSWLSWLSPIGWTQQVRAYAGDRWWVLALPVLLFAVLVPAAFALRLRRDLGAGLVQPRPGPARGSIRLKWMLRPCAKASAEPGRMLGPRCSR